MIYNKTKLTRQIYLCDVAEVVEAVILHRRNVIVHQQQPGQPGAGVGEPGGGHGLQVIVGQREDREAENQSEGLIIGAIDQSELTWRGRRARPGRG